MFGRISTRLTIFGICLAAGCGDAGGNPEPADDSESEALGLVETIPAPLETDVDTDADLSVLFDEPLSEGSVTSASLTLESADGAHSGTVSLAGEDMLVFTPSEPLALLTEYTAAVHDVEAQSGALLAEDHSWRFTTRDGHWGPEQLVNHTPTSPGATRVAVGPNGEAIAAWVENGADEQVWSSRYSPDTGWGTPERIDSLESREIDGLAVAFDASGNAIATWRWSDGFGVRGSIWVNRYSPTVGWGVAQEVGTPGDFLFDAPRLSVHPDGHAFLVWRRFGELRGCQFTPAAGWSVEEVVHREESVSDPYVVAGPSRTATLMWSAWDGERNNIWSAQYEATGGWGSPELVETDNQGSARNPRAVVDRSGNVTAVWRQHDSLRDNIWANRYTPGEGWGAARRIEASNAGDAAEPRLRIDAGGDVLAVWQQFDGERYGIWSNRLSSAAGWGVAQAFGGNTSSDAYAPELVVDPNGNAIAIWQQRQDGATRILASRFSPASGWGTEEHLALPTGSLSGAALDMGRDGRALAVWGQWSDSASAYAIRVRRFE